MFVRGFLYIDLYIQNKVVSTDLNISTDKILAMVKQTKDELSGLGIDFDGDILFSEELSPKLPSLDEELANLSLEPDEGIEEDLEE